jgi:hypothetical protein
MKNTEEQKKEDLLNNMLSIQEYMPFIEIIKEDPNNPVLKKLNKSTFNILSKLSQHITQKIPLRTFETKESVRIWLDSQKYDDLIEFERQLTILKKKRKSADRWNTASDIFDAISKAFRALTQIPVISIIANPIANGASIFSYLFWAIAIKNDPALGDKHDHQKSTANKISAAIGGISIICMILSVFPPLWPVVVPIAGLTLLISNAAYLVTPIVELYHAIKEGKEHPERVWKIRGRSLALACAIGSVAIAALAVIPLFVPVAWAVGTAAIVFVVGSAVSSLAVFGMSKFCLWQASKKTKAAHENQNTPHHKKTPAPTTVEKKNSCLSLHITTKKLQP